MPSSKDCCGFTDESSTSALPLSDFPAGLSRCITSSAVVPCSPPAFAVEAPGCAFSAGHGLLHVNTRVVPRQSASASDKPHVLSLEIGNLPKCKRCNMRNVSLLERSFLLIAIYICH